MKDKFYWSILYILSRNKILSSILKLLIPMRRIYEISLQDHGKIINNGFWSAVERNFQQIISAWKFFKRSIETCESTITLDLWFQIKLEDYFYKVCDDVDLLTAMNFFKGSTCSDSYKPTHPCLLLLKVKPSR